MNEVYKRRSIYVFYIFAKCLFVLCISRRCQAFGIYPQNDIQSAKGTCMRIRYCIIHYKLVTFAGSVVLQTYTSQWLCCNAATYFFLVLDLLLLASLFSSHFSHPA